MIYPNNYENKIGFSEIRTLLKERCLSSLGREMVDEMTFSDNANEVNEWLQQVREFRRLKETTDDFPMQYFFDVRESVARIRLANTHLEENEVFDLRRSLETISNIVIYLNRDQNAGREGLEPSYAYPALQRLTTDIMTFPAMIRRIDSILDKYGRIKDSASMTLASIRHDLQKMEGSISRTLYTILHSAQREGLVDKDAAPTMRDGRLMIPVAPGLKRKINGIVHDESATGKTVFIEPAEVVEANNRVRELDKEAMSLARKRNAFLTGQQCKDAPSALYLASDISKVALKASNARLKTKALSSIANLGEGARHVVSYGRMTRSVFESRDTAGSPFSYIPVVYTVTENLAAPNTFALQVIPPATVDPKTQAELAAGVRRNQDKLQGSNQQELMAVRTAFANKIAASNVDARVSSTMMGLFDASFFSSGQGAAAPYANAGGTQAMAPGAQGGAGGTQAMTPGAQGGDVR